MAPSPRMQRALRNTVILLAVIGIAVVVRRVVVLMPTLLHGYAAPKASTGAAAQFGALDDVFARHPSLTLIHIIPGLVFMILGPLQFSETFRARHLKWHKISGRVFLVTSGIIGVSALVMSFGMQAIGGVNQAAATTLFSLLFLFCLAKAFRHVLRGEIALHREWMIRGFAIGLAVATIRPIVGIFFATSRLTGLTPHKFFGAAFWIGFVVQSIVAEVWIRWTGGEREAGRVREVWGGARGA